MAARRDLDDFAIPPPRIFLFQTHAVGVVGDRSGPVGEDAQDPHLFGQHVQGLVHVAILLDGGAGRIEVIVRRFPKIEIPLHAKIVCPNNDRGHADV